MKNNCRERERESQCLMKSSLLGHISEILILRELTHGVPECYNLLSCVQPPSQGFSPMLPQTSCDWHVRKLSKWRDVGLFFSVSTGIKTSQTQRADCNFPDGRTITWVCTAVWKSTVCSLSLRHFYSSFSLFGFTNKQDLIQHMVCNNKTK